MGKIGGRRSPKITISLPAELHDKIVKLMKERHDTKSGIIADLLRQVLIGKEK